MHKACNGYRLKRRGKKMHCCLHFRASFLLKLTFCEEIAPFFTFSKLSTFTKNLLKPSLFTCELCMPLISYLSLTCFPNSYVLLVSNVLTKGCCFLRSTAFNWFNCCKYTLSSFMHLNLNWLSLRLSPPFFACTPRTRSMQL